MHPRYESSPTRVERAVSAAAKRLQIYLLRLTKVAIVLLQSQSGASLSTAAIADSV